MKKIKIFIIVIYIVSYLQFSLNQITYPQIAAKCALKDSACLTKQAQITLQAFVEGIPELGIQKIDKLHVDDVIIKTDNFSYGWINITVAGMRNAIIDNVRINVDLNYIRVLFHATLTLDFDYYCNGIALSLFNVFGEGKGRITLIDMQMEILFVYDIIKDDNGKDVMDLKTHYHGFRPVGGVYYNFTNVFNGDPKRTEVLLKLMNESWRIIVGKFGDFFNKKMSDKLFDALKTYMRSRPLEELALY